MNDVSAFSEVCDNKGRHNIRPEILKSPTLMSDNSLVLHKNYKTLFGALNGVPKGAQFKKSGTIAIVELPDYKIRSTVSEFSSDFKDLLLIFKDKDCDMKTYMRSMIKDTGSTTINTVTRDREISASLGVGHFKLVFFDKDAWLLQYAAECDREKIESEIDVTETVEIMRKKMVHKLELLRKVYRKT